MARSLLLGAVVVVAVSACPPPPGSNDGGTGGGQGGGGAQTPFAISDLDADARGALALAAAFDPSQERVGVVYATPRGTETNPGHPDFDLKYVEWKQGARVAAPQTIRFVQRVVGLSIAFDPVAPHEPVVSYLGGAAGFVPGDSIYWFQSDAVINRRSGGVLWTETVVATNGGQVICNNRVSDRGFLVGLWPSLAFDSTGKLYLAYRDGHDGASGGQDWRGSDLEMWEGTPTPNVGSCTAPGGNSADAYGGHATVVIGRDDLPAVIHDQMFGGSDSDGTNVLFQRRLADAGWTPPTGTLLTIGNTQSGASLAYDSTEGYGIAVMDLERHTLGYVNSTDGANWSSIDAVYASGSGGWYPSLAMDPENHEPTIAFVVCGPKEGMTATACKTNDDELRVAQRGAGQWHETVVDSGGAYLPKLGFFQTSRASKRVVVYRTPPSVDSATGLPVANTGALKIAVER